ncbi:MAG: transcription antitermination factor NusB [Treponema sp.]|nr:transcription antitermination factor NusB [Treponema sp.]
MSRRKGRVLAFQALYSHEVGGVPVEDLLTFSWANESGIVAADSDEEYLFARFLVTGTMEHLEEIDVLIKSHLAANWNFDRLNKVSLSILRMSVYSLLYQKDTSASIVIDEAVNIAKDFGADDSFKFINAVLDKISKAAQQKE